MQVRMYHLINRDGKGICRYRVGSVYNGMWLNDLYHGQGKLEESGTVYVGAFLNGKKNGRGVITWTGRKTCYDGDWQDN